MQTSSAPKLAVISGASSGIGAATARRLGREGWRIALIARNRDALDRLAREIGPGATVFALDASDGAAVSAAAEKIRRDLGTPDVLVNCAGAGSWKFIEETSPAEAVAMIGAPYLAAFNLSHAFMPAMLARRSGLLIHVNSPASALPWPGATGYAATRWALRGLHEALHLDLAGTGVRSSHVVFSKVTSDYFTNNPDSEQHLPAVARFVPELTPERCAEVIRGVIRRPRREVITPLMLRIFYGTNAVLPGLIRWLAVRTGRRHSA